MRRSSNIALGLNRRGLFLWCYRHLLLTLRVWRVGETLAGGQVARRWLCILLRTMLRLILLSPDAALAKRWLISLRSRLRVLKIRVLWQDVIAETFTPDTIPRIFPFSVPIRPCMVILGATLATAFECITDLMALTVRQGPIVVVLHFMSSVMRRILCMLLVLMTIEARACAPRCIKRRRIVEASNSDGTGVRLGLELWLSRIRNWTFELTVVLTLVKTLLSCRLRVLVFWPMLQRLCIPTVVKLGRLLLVPTPRTPVNLLSLTMGNGSSIRW